jgi:hypothetical protein
MEPLTATATAGGETITAVLYGTAEEGSIVISDARQQLITLNARRLNALISALTGLRALVGWREEREERSP